ncbi:MAG: hypothetical protein SGPRY_002969, partial [Prymnesium sp.]
MLAPLLLPLSVPSGRLGSAVQPPRAASHAIFTRRALLASLPIAYLPSAALTADEPFSLSLPPGYVRSKRQASQGTIFVGGNFPRASVISVTAWPIKELLQQDAEMMSLPGLPATSAIREPTGPITSLDDLGQAQQLALLLARARDRDASSGALQSELTSYTSS